MVFKELPFRIGTAENAVPWDAPASFRRTATKSRVPCIKVRLRVERISCHCHSVDSAEFDMNCQQHFVNILSRVDYGSPVRIDAGGAYDHMFFVWHSDDIGENDESNVMLVGPDRLARMVFDTGLTSWLREKVS